MDQNHNFKSLPPNKPAHNFKSVLAGLWQICLFNQGPQHLPYNPSLLLGFVIFNVLLGWYQFAQAFYIVQAFALSVIYVSVSALFAYVVLYLRKKIERFVQTLMALVGTTIILNLMLLIALQILIKSGLLNTLAQSRFILVLFGLYALAINVWTVGINGHIFKNALDLTLLQGILVGIALGAAYFLVYQLIV